MKTMQDLKLKIEVLQISIYSNIIKQILKRHNNLSVNKIIAFAYLIKKEKFIMYKVYTAKNTQDVVCKAISLLAGQYTEYCENITYILKAIHLLIEKEQIKINNNVLSVRENIEMEKAMYEENPFLQKAIEMSKKMTDRQFMKEVISNV
ncbi:hypothetical protein WB006_04395 [Clostridium botulinum]